MAQVDVGEYLAEQLTEELIQEANKHLDAPMNYRETVLVTAIVSALIVVMQGAGVVPEGDVDTDALALKDEPPAKNDKEFS